MLPLRLIFATPQESGLERRILSAIGEPDLARPPGNPGRRRRQMRRRLATGAAGLLALAGLLGGCAATPTPIGTVLQKAAALNGKTVTVQGRVGGGASLLGSGAYQVTDSSGTIWVLTRSGSPAPRSGVTIDGKVHQVLQVGPYHVVGLEEVSRY